jgi:hypothetical protein
MLSKKIALIKLVEEIKSHSSKWIKTKGPEYLNFYWQSGYGVAGGIKYRLLFYNIGYTSPEFSERSFTITVNQDQISDMTFY